MDVHLKLAEIRATVAEARPVPMSASCVVNRIELLEAVDELGVMLRKAYQGADQVAVDRDAVLEQARTDAREIIAEAERERGGMVADTDIATRSRQEADELLRAAREEASDLRRETDDYVDERLANFELTLSRTLEAVQRGRERLQQRSALDFGGSDPDDIVLPDPAS